MLNNRIHTMLLKSLAVIATALALARSQATYVDVQDAASLLRALRNGVEHIVVSAHLNLTAVDASGVALDIQPTTRSIRVRRCL